MVCMVGRPPLLATRIGAGLFRKIFVEPEKWFRSIASGGLGANCSGEGCSHKGASQGQTSEYGDLDVHDQPFATSKVPPS
jgi:hypothetical protein